MRIVKHEGNVITVERRERDPGDSAAHAHLYPAYSHSALGRVFSVTPLFQST